MASAHIEYNNQYVPQNLLDVEQLSSCAIEASNDDGLFYYLIIKTSLGTSTIVTCGPVVPDVNLLPDGYSVTLNRMKYDDNKVESVVIKWLNDKKKITDAKILPIEDAIAQIRDLGEYMQNYSDEVY